MVESWGPPGDDPRDVTIEPPVAEAAAGASRPSIMRRVLNRLRGPSVGATLGDYSDRWAKVPVGILELPLSRHELRAFVAISGHAGGDRVAEVGTPRLAAELHVARRSMRRLLELLRARRLIVPLGRPTGNAAMRYLVAPFPVGASGSATERARAPSAVGASGSANRRAPKARPDGASAAGRMAHPGRFDGASGGATNREQREQSAPANAEDGSPPRDPHPPVDGWAIVGDRLAGRQTADGASERDAQAEAFLALAEEWVRTPGDEREAKVPLSLLRTDRPSPASARTTASDRPRRSDR